MTSLEYIEKQTGENPQYLIIWLHGLGADGHDFEPVVPVFEDPSLPLKFIFPHAPVQPVTINGGVSMRAWYDIKMMDIGKQPDEKGIIESDTLVRNLIEEQISEGFDSNRIILAGFSQGGAIALYTGTRLTHNLAGIIALSCYVPMQDKLAGEKAYANEKTPIFMAHGTHDPVVPFELGKQGHTLLQSEGYQTEWKEYPIQHGVSPEELEDIKAWITQLAR